MASGTSRYFILLVTICQATGIQLAFKLHNNGSCFYPGERALLNCSHRIWPGVTLMYWKYSTNSLTFLEFSRIPNARTLANETTDTAHVVEVIVVDTMDGNSVQCGFETFEEGIILSNAIIFHVAPATGSEQNWTLSVLPRETSHVASFLLMQITFTSHQYCAQRRAMIAISSEAYNASSNMTLQENDKLPLVKRVTQTLLNITNLLRCVHYRHHVSVLYPGLGETEQKVYEDTSMLRPGLPKIEFNKLSAGGIGIVTLKMTKASCYPHTSTAYTLTLKEVTDTANITVLWRSHDCGGSRSSLSQSGNTWTYQGDFRQGQEEMMWLVKLTSVTSSRDTKLRVVTSFGNTVGEITSTADFKVAIDTPSENTQDLSLAIALYITTPLLSILTATSLTIACAFAVKLHRIGRKKNITSGSKPPLYDTVVASHSATRPETEDPPTAATPNPSYIPLEHLLMSHTVHQQDHV